MPLIPDMAGRLRSLIPSGWFSRDAAPNRDAVIGGLSDTLSWVADRQDYARAQTRISTARGFWLDLVAWDFFGGRFMRRPNEPDEAFRPRILAEILRPRNTRAAIIRAVSDLGCQATLFEPWNTGDCGAYGIGMAYAGSSPQQAVTGYSAGTIGGYGVGQIAYLVPSGMYGSSPGAGCWGSLNLNNQVFIRVERGAAIIANADGVGGYGQGGALAYAGGDTAVHQFGGYGSSLGGYGIGSTSFSAPQTIYGSVGAGFYTLGAPSVVTDAEIYARIAETTAAGVTPWTAINVAA